MNDASDVRPMEALPKVRPYAFVPYPDCRPQKEAPPPHDRLVGHSGTLHCELEALSPLLVIDSEHRAQKNHGVHRFCEEGGADGHPSYVIPGTSLKGVFRSVFEVLCPSCVPVSDGKTRRADLIPTAVSACSSRRALCPACRTFGAMCRDGVHKGLVQISQAVVHERAEVGREMRLIPLFGAHPEIDSIYKPGGQPAGRKFYYHQQRPLEAVTPNEVERGQMAEPLQGRQGDRPGATFRFTVSYRNLGDEELRGLVAALTLSDRAPFEGASTRVRHKLGYGKPAGLGSVEVRLLKAVLQPSPEARYSQFGIAPRVLRGGELEAWVRPMQEAHFSEPSPPVQVLIEILRYPHARDRTYGYPTW